MNFEEICEQYKDNAKKYLIEECGISEYREIKNCGVLPIYTCPNCDFKQFVKLKDSNNFFCFHCEYKKEKNELFNCNRCGNYISGDNQYCDECLDYFSDD